MLCKTREKRLTHFSLVFSVVPKKIVSRVPLNGKFIFNLKKFIDITIGFCYNEVGSIVFLEV